MALKPQQLGRPRGARSLRSRGYKRAIARIPKPRPTSQQHSERLTPNILAQSIVDALIGEDVTMLRTDAPGGRSLGVRWLVVGSEVLFEA